MATPALPPPIKTIHAYVDDYTQAPDPPTVLSFSSYLEDQTKHFWNTSVAWEAYQRGMMISETDVNSIKKLDSLLRKQDSKALCDHFEVYLQTLYRLLQSLNKDDTLQYLLALTNLLIQDYPTVVSKFHDFSKVDAELPYTLFTKLLTKENDFISTVATKILTFLVCSSPTEVSFDLSPLYVAFMSQLSNSNPQIVDVTIQAIQSFLSVVSLRMKFYSFKSGKLNSSLLDALNKTTNPQIQYQVIYCFWLLSFEVDIAKTIQTQFNIIPSLVEIGKGAIKEKIIRVVLATFRNLIHLAPLENTNIMIGSKVVPLLTLWKQQRQLEDPEIKEDIDLLITHLKDALQKLSTFDEYSSELKSGKLEWSPVHTSELFWKQTVTRLNENDYELIRILARHLSLSTNPLVLAVAAHDLGCYIQHHSLGRKILQEIGAKHRLMELMSNEDASVRYQALMAVQKFMTNSWDM